MQLVLKTPNRPNETAVDVEDAVLHELRGYPPDGVAEHALYQAQRNAAFIAKLVAELRYSCALGNAAVLCLLPLYKEAK